MGENPIDKEKAFLGITLNIDGGTGFRSLLRGVLFFSNSTIYYEEINQPLVFFYYLVWWIVIINFFVALFNMLPVGILDGGRFFYLTILGLTRSEKITKKIYKIMVYFIIIIFLLLILSWLFALGN